MWNKASVFSFDSHSRNDQGFHDPDGKATLLEFRSMTSLNKFLKTFFIENVMFQQKHNMTCSTFQLMYQEKINIEF